MVDGLKLQSIADMIADLEDEQLTTFEAFVGWCKRAGIDTAAVDGSSSASEGGGLVAARAIGADDTILAVPLDVSLEVDVKRPHLAPHAALLAALAPTHALALAVCLSTTPDADLATTEPTHDPGAEMAALEAWLRGEGWHWGARG